MKVHLIRKRTIENYIKLNPESATALGIWTDKLKGVSWTKPTDMKETYNSADLLGKNSHKVIFNLGGNTYRMICKYAFGQRQVHLYICWIGTHPEYDRICKEKRQYTINNYKYGNFKIHRN